MGSLDITPVVAGLLAIFYVVLSGRVISLRRRDVVGIGHGDSHDLRRAIRVHANFGEYVPLAVVLLALLELSDMLPGWSLWAFAVVLFLSRVLHAVGMSRSAGTSFGRLSGTALILTYLLVAGVLLVLIGVHNVFLAG